MGIVCSVSTLHVGGFLNLGYHFGGLYNKDPSTLGSILGFP